MKRLLFLAAFFFVGTGTASADYVLLKVNLNQLNFLPVGGMPMDGMKGAAGPGNPAGMAGGKGAGGGFGGMPAGGGFGGMPAGGGFGGMPAGGGMPAAGGGGGVPPVNQMGAFGGAPDANPLVNPYDKFFPPDPNARWVTALVEINNVKGQATPPFGSLVTCDTRWGKNVWIPVLSPVFPMIGAPRVPAKAFTDEFAAEFAKEKKDKNIETMLRLARWTLSRGQLKKFHEVMDEAAKINDKHVNVKHYLRVKKGLEPPFKTQDPSQRDLIENLTRTGYKENQSKKGHYGIYAPNLEDPAAEASIRRRLNLLEETLETFYFWFAVQKDLSAQPALPKHRLIAIVAGSKDDFYSRHVDWGSMPRVADGFTPQRDNVIVMSAKPRIDDPNYAELVSLINSKLADANTKLQQGGLKMVLTPENLLTGEVNTWKESGRVAVFVGAAQTAVLLAKALEDQAERHTVTNEGTRQLLVASGLFPRSVQVPDWIVEGLASFFETPAGTAHPTVGERSCIHLISFRYQRANNPDFKNPPDVLQSVISDAYFQKARQMNKDLQTTRDEKERRRLKESWEVARCSSWAFIYYLAQNRKLDYVFNYGKELDKLPRDMDLSGVVMQGCFANAFEMKDPVHPLMISDPKLKNMAAHWFQVMEVNLDNPQLQAFLEKERAKQNPATAPVIVASNPNPNQNPGVDPGEIRTGTNDPAPPNPNPANQDLAGSSWGGKETLPGYGPLAFQFNANGQAIMTDKDGNTQGTYNKTGNNITIQFGPAVYTGTINGNTMQGTATNGMKNWSWTVSNGAQATPGLNPGLNQPPPGPGPGPMPPGPRPINPKGKGPKGPG